MPKSIRDSYKKSQIRHSKASSPSRDIFRIAMYRRVSTREQVDEGQSLQAQLGKITNYIKFDSSFENKTVEAIDFVDEGVSAKDLKRSNLQKLLQAVRNNTFDFVIVVKLDRLTRSLVDLQTLITLFEIHKVKLVSINEKIDTQTATGRFFISILGSIAQLEREQISERVHDTFEQMVYNQPVGGPTPFGYIYSFVKPKEYIAYTRKNALLYNIPSLRVYDESNDDIYPGDYLKCIFDWFISYKSISRVCENLNNIAIPIPKVILQHVNNFTSRNTHKDSLESFIIVLEPGKWSRSTVRDILLNPFYTGVRVWNRFESRTNRERDSSDWIFVENSHEPLIDQETYFTVTSLYDEVKRFNITKRMRKK